MAGETIWTCDVYAISDGLGNVKFGVAKDIASRLKGLQCGNAHPLQLLFSIRCSNLTGREVSSVAHLVENNIHRALAPQRMTGEWFAIDYYAALAQMEQSIEDTMMHPWPERYGVEIDGVFIEKPEDQHIWYWPTNDAHARGIIQ